MRICVYGAGAIGGWLAGLLAESGAEVSVMARGAHLAAIRAQGLTLEMQARRITARVAASDSPAELGPQDAVVVTVKAPALPSVAAGIGPLLGPDTMVAFVTNGLPWWYFHAHGGKLEGRRLARLDPQDALWRAVGPQRVIGGIAWPASSVPSPGVVRMVSGETLGVTFGEPDGSVTPRLRMLEGAFQAAGVPVAVSDNIRDLIWQKLIFNLSAGPMCVLTQSPVLATQEEPVLVETSRRALAEAEAVARAMGRSPVVDVERIVATNAKLGHRPSILQDLEAGRPMEVDALYTVTLEMARMVGVATPTLDLLVSLIKVRARAAGLYGG
ncbi:MAG TPA: 2-dehydropantoate 2-reductase [Acetobacteraceae bacterium]